MLGLSFYVKSRDVLHSSNKEKNPCCQWYTFIFIIFKSECWNRFKTEAAFILNVLKQPLMVKLKHISIYRPQGSSGIGTEY